ncbi:uncharacterized protein PV09_04513 [Verruconis gallopava]|uniref:FAD-binding PCMH-type domain-containing protein n=1 Tax=Verruconis gallopava TaxID=253628 RepID=A0A0D2ACI1_9PEZI|nr:uncharacterized protein PV09_04513 [Verruconis gallopava]KIW04205.1 hypothetical protein PV09_04513 [Verruconis gallopava]
MGQSQALSAFKKDLAAALNNDDELFALPDEPFYIKDHVKRYNLDIETTPLAVTYPKTTAQVSSIVKLAKDNNLKVQAKCGGHSYANFCDPNGGIIVDLKHFQKFEIDENTWRCRVGGGTLLGDLTKRMFEPHKRAMAHGTCPTVGIGGHATIGGLGPSSRLWGAALDHVEEVEMVVANGDVIRANENENSDIFWAVKGAGASFGVITEFVVRTEPAPGRLVQYSYSFTTGSWKDMAKTFKAWQTYVSQPDLTRSFASTATITELGLTISVTYFGTDEEFDKINFAKNFPGNQTPKTIVFDDYLGAVGHWAEDVALEIISPLPAHSYTKTLTFNHCNQIPDSVIDRMFKYFEEVSKGTLVWFAIFDLAGGRVNDIPQDATAYAHRDALFYLQSYAVNPFGPVSNKSKQFLQGLNKVIRDGMAEAGENTDLGAYAGYVDLELGAGAQKAYWRTNLPRLESIKLKWDPEDVFHNPQSVRPGGNDVISTPKVVYKKAGFLARLKGCFR